MKTALVTGGTRGIGLSTAQKFINQGWNVYITSRKEENLEAVLSENSKLKGFVARADDLAAASETCRKIVDETGSIDVLINNAGTNPSGGTLLDVDLSAVQKNMGCKFNGSSNVDKRSSESWIKRISFECLFRWRNKTITLHGGLQYFKSWINLYDKAISNGACARY